jgi:hypothetical protein
MVYHNPRDDWETDIVSGTLCFLEYWTMDIVQKPSDRESYDIIRM